MKIILKRKKDDYQIVHLMVIHKSLFRILCIEGVVFDFTKYVMNSDYSEMQLFC